MVIALPAEAKPVRRHFDLQREQESSPFPLYRNSEIALVLSGPGKESAGKATTWLYQHLRPQTDALWLNLGIAGHSDRAVGEAVQANLIEDRVSGDCWNTVLARKPALENERVITLDTPDLDYSQAGVVDMEAAGFYRAALEFTAAEQILCIKVISDNRQQPASQINGKRVSGLIEQQTELLDTIVGSYRTG